MGHHQLMCPTDMLSDAELDSELERNHEPLQLGFLAAAE